jgi:hypothetical protein
MIGVVACLLSLVMLSGPHQKTDMTREAEPRDNATLAIGDRCRDTEHSLGLLQLFNGRQFTYQ